jgi:hypothetical protein
VEATASGLVGRKSPLIKGHKMVWALQTEHHLGRGIRPPLGEDDLLEREQIILTVHVVYFKQFKGERWKIIPGCGRLQDL